MQSNIFHYLMVALLWGIIALSIVSKNLTASLGWGAALIWYLNWRSARKLLNLSLDLNEEQSKLNEALNKELNELKKTS